MGQKINPKIFRLITSQKSLSNWYTTKINYANLIKEDDYIRGLCKKFWGNVFLISKIEINRFFNKTKTFQKNLTTFENVYLLFIGTLPTKRSLILLSKKLFCTISTEKLIKLLQSRENRIFISSYLFQLLNRLFLRKLQINSNKFYHLNFQFISNTFFDPLLISMYIGELLGQRVAFKRIFKLIINVISNDSSFLGIKIQLSGRLDEAEMAQTEWIQLGRIPTHTLSVPLDYSSYKVKTRKGVIGIKIWLNLSKFKQEANILW